MAVPSILITGGSRGIGAATAKLAARRGYRVCFSYLKNKTQAQSVVAEIESSDGTAIAVQSDASKESDVTDLWRVAIAEFGSVNALVNNAGILDLQSRLEDRLSVRFWFAASAVDRGQHGSRE